MWIQLSHKIDQVRLKERYPTKESASYNNPFIHPRHFNMVNFIETDDVSFYPAKQPSGNPLSAMLAERLLVPNLADSTVIILASMALGKKQNWTMRETFDSTNLCGNLVKAMGAHLKVEDMKESGNALEASIFQTRCCSVICHLTNASNVNTNQFLVAGAVSAVVNAMKAYPDAAPLQIIALDALRRLLSGERAAFFAETNEIVVVVLAAVKIFSHDDSVLLRSFKCLTKLFDIHGDRKLKAIIIKNGGGVALAEEHRALVEKKSRLASRVYKLLKQLYS